MSKVYLKFEWVNNAAEATQDAEESATKTVNMLRSAELEEAPLGWIITAATDRAKKQDYVHEFTG